MGAKQIPRAKRGAYVKPSRNKPRNYCLEGCSGDTFFIEQISKASARNNRDEDVFIAQSTAQQAGELSIYYSIQPGKEWQALMSYKEITLHDLPLKEGDTVFVAKSLPLPDPPSTDASVEEVLAYDRANYWIAKMVECRVKDGRPKHMLIRWVFWPEELPSGRKPYHGRNEVIMSNHVDIVDVSSIAQQMPVNYWSESDQDEYLGYLYWRQTYNLLSGELSEPRQHCACRHPYKPELTMYQCPNQSCRTWNHEQCLMDHTLSQTFSRGEPNHKNTLANCHSSNDTTSELAKSDDIRGTLCYLLRNLGSLLSSKSHTPATKEVETEEEADTKTLPAFPFMPPTSDDERPWLTRFSAVVEVEKYVKDVGEEEEAVIAMIMDEDRKTTYKKPLYCLKCGAILV